MVMRIAVINCVSVGHHSGQQCDCLRVKYIFAVLSVSYSPRMPLRFRESMRTQIHVYGTAADKARATLLFSLRYIRTAVVTLKCLPHERSAGPIKVSPL